MTVPIPLRPIRVVVLQRWLSVAARLQEWAGTMAFLNATEPDAKVLLQMSDIIGEASEELRSLDEAIAEAGDDLTPHLHKLEGM